MSTTDYKDWLSTSYQPIAGGALESNIIGIWFQKQTAKGTPTEFNTASEATHTIKRGRWVGGDVQVNRSDGEEAWSDQTYFADHVDYINTIVGNGAPVVQGQSGVVGLLAYLGMGEEVLAVSGVSALVQYKCTAPQTTGTVIYELTTAQTTYKTAEIQYNATANAAVSAMVTAFPFGWTWANLEVLSGSSTVGSTAGFTIKFKEVLGNQPIATSGTTGLKFTQVGLVGGSGAWTTTTAGKNTQKILKNNAAGGFYFGVYKSVGKTTQYKAQFNDCRMQSLRLEASSASKVLKVTPTFISLNPGELEPKALSGSSYEPSKTDDEVVPFVYTQAQGTYEIDGQIYHGQSAFALNLVWGMTEFYGDQVHPWDLVNTVATASIEGLTLLIDEAGAKRYYQQIYGTEVPAHNAKPLEVLPLIGSYKCQFVKENLNTGSNNETLTLEMFGVKWVPSLNIPANPAGGPVELSFSGMMRKSLIGQAFKSKTYAETKANPFLITIENQEAEGFK